VLDMQAAMLPQKLLEGLSLVGGRIVPKQRSPGPASGATTRGETCKLLPARYCRSKVDSTDPGVGGGAYGDFRNDQTLSRRR
jgi:hypothetical protein